MPIGKAILDCKIPKCDMNNMHLVCINGMVSTMGCGRGIVEVTHLRGANPKAYIFLAIGCRLQEVATQNTKTLLTLV